MRDMLFAFLFICVYGLRCVFYVLFVSCVLCFYVLLSLLCSLLFVLYFLCIFGSLLYFCSFFVVLTVFVACF